MNLLPVKNISKEFVSANQRTFAIGEIGFEVKEHEFISVFCIDMVLTIKSIFFMYTSIA